MKTTILNSELTNQMFLNMSKNRGYNLNQFADKLMQFAPQVHLLDITIANDTQSLEDYQQAMLEYTTPLIEQMLEQTIIPDRTTLISIDTKQNDDMGFHIWTFALNNIEDFDEDETSEVTLTECFKDIFPYDPQACFGHAPQIRYCNGLFYILHPFTF